MAEHFSKNVVEATFWCKKCGKPTPHYVSDGLRGSCKTCITKLEALPKVTPPAQQGSLF
jgi:Zn finger protein HypA/HybF involved in hydrogenase expression